MGHEVEVLGKDVSFLSYRETGRYDRGPKQSKSVHHGSTGRGEREIERTNGGGSYRVKE